MVVSSLEKILIQKAPKKSKLLLAVSGGPDSMALLYAAVAVKDQHDLTLQCCYFDHHLRPDGDKESEFIREHCDRLGVPFHAMVAQEDAPKSNIEAWARAVRYEALFSVRKKQELNLVVTAHTASDVAETLIMKLVTKKECTTIIEHDPDRKLLRPLLAIPRSEVHQYLKERSIPYIEDPSNQDNRFLRNRIRNQLFPVLHSNFGTEIERILADQAVAIDTDLNSLHDALTPTLQELGELPFGTKRWLAALNAKLSSISENMQWRLAELLFRDKLGFKLGRDASYRLVTFLKGHAAELHLPGGQRIRRFSGGLTVDSHENLP